MTPAFLFATVSREPTYIQRRAHPAAWRAAPDVDVALDAASGAPDPPGFQRA